jgi:hypothetical protein
VSLWTYDKLNARQVKALADEHIGMYEARLFKAKNGAKNIRVDECQSYLGIWRSIAAKVTQESWRLRLTKQEVNEIRDAIAVDDFQPTLEKHSDPPS